MRQIELENGWSDLTSLASTFEEHHSLTVLDTRIFKTHTEVELTSRLSN